LRRTGAFAALIGFEAGAIAMLHQMGTLNWMIVPWGRLGMWLELAPVEDVLAASLRLIALVAAYWIAATTAAYALAKVSRLPRLVSATAWATLPSVRGVIDRTIAVAATAVALTSPVAPALAGNMSSPPPTVEPVVYEISGQGVPTPVNTEGRSETVVTPPGTDDAGYSPQPAGGVELPTRPSAGETVHQVEVGDNLWTISETRLATMAPGGESDAASIATYWRRVIELNTPHLRSGDPNLIHPGEQILLPSIEPEETV